MFSSYNKVVQQIELLKRVTHFSYPIGKIAEKAMWRSVLMCVEEYILDADSTKTHSSGATF